MTYTPAKPPLPVSIEELRTTIPGWGVDLDPADRPAVPRLQFDPTAEARVALLEQQPELWPRERSIEHARLTPVFGTSCPPKGVSGALRKYSYARFSEGRAAHWLLLVTADRVDAFGAHARSLLTLRPDNPITQSGIRSEVTHHGIASRFGHKRADVALQLLDPIIVIGPWLFTARAVLRGARKLGLRRRR